MEKWEGQTHPHQRPVPRSEGSCLLGCSQLQLQLPPAVTRSEEVLKHIPEGSETASPAAPVRSCSHHVPGPDSGAPVPPRHHPRAPGMCPAVAAQLPAGARQPRRLGSLTGCAFPPGHPELQPLWRREGETTENKLFSSCISLFC